MKKNGFEIRENEDFILEEEKPNNKRKLWSWVKGFIIAFIVIIIIRHFFFTSYVVKSFSMKPNIQLNNRLIVNKFPYDFGKKPHYGDIIVIQKTPDQKVVTRVIGLPNDTIVYKNDQLYRNGKKISEPYINQYKQKFEAKHGQTYTQNFSFESINQMSFIPMDKLLVVGDNRQFSDFSLVDMSQVVGKVYLRYYPFNEIKQY